MVTSDSYGFMARFGVSDSVNYYKIKSKGISIITIRQKEWLAAVVAAVASTVAALKAVVLEVVSQVVNIQDPMGFSFLVLTPTEKVQAVTVEKEETISWFVRFSNDSCSIIVSTADAVVTKAEQDGGKKDKIWNLFVENVMTRNGIVTMG